MDNGFITGFVGLRLNQNACGWGAVATGQVEPFHNRYPRCTVDSVLRLSENNHCRLYSLAQ